MPKRTTFPNQFLSSGKLEWPRHSLGKTFWHIWKLPINLRQHCPFWKWPEETWLHWNWGTCPQGIPSTRDKVVNWAIHSVFLHSKHDRWNQPLSCCPQVIWHRWLRINCSWSTIYLQSNASSLRSVNFRKSKAMTYRFVQLNFWLFAWLNKENMWGKGNLNLKWDHIRSKISHKGRSEKRFNVSILVGWHLPDSLTFIKKEVNANGIASLTGKANIGVMCLGFSATSALLYDIQLFTYTFLWYHKIRGIT